MKDLSRTAKLLAVFFLAVNIFTLAACKIDPVYGAMLLEEDRFVENMTALALFFAAVYVLYRSLENIRNKRFLKGIIQLILALLLIFMSGEEISWGQRIFHWQTTGIFKKDNLQNETNFHNMQVDGVKLNKVIFTNAFFAIGIFVFVLAPYLYKKKEGFRNFFNRLGATLPSYKQTILLTLGLLFTVLIQLDRQWELWEFNAAIVILWTVAEPINAGEIYFNKRRMA